MAYRNTLKYSMLLVLSAQITSFTSAEEAEDIEEGGNFLEETIVTTERRAQNILNVPLSVTSLNAETRAKTGIISISEMISAAPGVSYNVGDDRPSIRGIGRQSNIFSIDSPVASYVDGVYTNTVQDASRRPIFVERIEILRGPQGALSGRNSIAGAIHTHYKKPEKNFSAEVGSIISEGSTYALEGTFTGPVNDHVRARLNLAQTWKQEGFFKNEATGETEGDSPLNRKTFEILVDADYGEDIDIYLKASQAEYNETRRRDVNASPFVAGTIGAPSPYGPGDPLAPLATYGYFSANAVTVGNSTQRPGAPVEFGGQDDHLKFLTNTKSKQVLTEPARNFTSHIDWYGPKFDAKWIFGRISYEVDTQWDADGTDVISMDIPVTSFAYPTGFRTVDPSGVAHYYEKIGRESNEVTFKSNTDSKLDWVAGFYYSSAKVAQRPYRLIHSGYDELNDPALNLGQLLGILWNGDFPTQGQNPAPNPIDHAVVNSELDIRNISYAGFGQLDYHLRDDLKISLGFRSNKDDKRVTENFRVITNSLGDDLAPYLAGAAFAGLSRLPLGPMAIDVTDSNVPDVLPEGVVRDYGIDPTTGNRVRDMAKIWSAKTGSLGIDWDINDDHFVYARFAKGYKPGGFNAGFVDPDPMLEKETVTSSEIGYKAYLSDQVKVMASAFVYDFENNQQPMKVLSGCTDPSDPSTCLTTIDSFVNVPKTESMGLETEIIWQARDDLLLYFTYGFLDASIKEGMLPGDPGYINVLDPSATFESANPYQDTGAIDDGYTFLPIRTQDISGNKLAGTPEHKLALVATYTRDLFQGELELSGSLFWRSSQYKDLFESEIYEAPSYSWLSMRATWRSPEENYRVVFFGKNLADSLADEVSYVERYATGSASALAPSADGATYFATNLFTTPRIFGMEFSYQFD